MRHNQISLLPGVTCFWKFLVSLLCQPAVAYDYSIQHAFCQDYASNRSSIHSPSFRYDLQVAYNRCMKNANFLIKQHEEEKESQRIQQIKNRQKWEAENEKRRQEEIKKSLEREREEDRRRRANERKEKELQILLDNADELFR